MEMSVTEDYCLKAFFSFMVTCPHTTAETLHTIQRLRIPIFSISHKALILLTLIIMCLDKEVQRCEKCTEQEGNDVKKLHIICISNCFKYLKIFSSLLFSEALSYLKIQKVNKDIKIYFFDIAIKFFWIFWRVCDTDDINTHHSYISEKSKNNVLWIIMCRVFVLNTIWMYCMYLYFTMKLP